MVIQVMANDMTSRITRDMPMDGSTPFRCCTNKGMTTSTKGEAPKLAVTAILYLRGGTTNGVNRQGEPRLRTRPTVYGNGANQQWFQSFLPLGKFGRMLPTAKYVVCGKLTTTTYSGWRWDL